MRGDGEVKAAKAAGGFVTVARRLRRGGLSIVHDVSGGEWATLPNGLLATVADVLAARKRKGQT